MCKVRVFKQISDESRVQTRLHIGSLKAITMTRCEIIIQIDNTMFDSQRFQVEKKLQDWIQALDEFLFLEVLRINWIEISQSLFDYIWLEQKQATLWRCDSGKTQTHTIDRMSEWEQVQQIFNFVLQKFLDDTLTVRLHILRFRTNEFIFVE